MDQKPVFYDPRGTRRTWVARLGAFIASVVAVLTTLTLLAALGASLLPKQDNPSKGTTLPGQPNANQRTADFLTAKFRHALTAEISAEQKRVAAPPRAFKGTIAAGFYAPWQSSGIASLRLHAPALTHLMPQWLHLKADGMNIDYSDFDKSVNPANQEVIYICKKNGIQLCPILDNQGGGNFDPKRLDALLSSPQAQKDVAHELSAWLTEFGFSGINLDFELVDEKQNAHFVQFLAVLKKEFAAKSLTVSLDVEAESPLPLDQVSDYVDFIILMAYDQHSEDGGAGPLADIDWSEKLIEKVLDSVPNEKLVLGMGNYAYDWVEGQDTAENITFQDAMTEAGGYRSEAPSKVIQFDSSSLNNTFAYRNDDDNKRHIVWMLDAVSAYNQWAAARDNQIAGAALWYMGAEDPSVWNFFDRQKLTAPMSPKSIETMDFPYEITFKGKGPILNILEDPQQGHRKLSLDAGGSGVIDSCVYTNYAFPSVVQRSGYIPKKLAITFDDGPDPTWTPQILDVLKENSVPAAFFVIGNSCESHPALVNREYLEGHQIGSHSFFHPNMGDTSRERDRLELNLTQLAIEAATGRSTILFRPPYNADSEPETQEQLKPIDVAHQAGYTTVAESIDPEDWDLAMHLPNGTFRKKTPQDIIDLIEGDIYAGIKNKSESNVILLHDGGGDRSATVAALRILIPKLRAQGFEFVPISTLMGTTRDAVMPPIPAKDWNTYILAKIVLGTTYWILWILSIAFIGAIALGLLRVTLMTTLALVKRRQEAWVNSAPMDYGVSVLIAAYNEEKVIVRTIESVLQTKHPILEVVVIDDGSSDGTAEVVRTAFQDDPRVQLVVQENGGKSAALNNGLSISKGEVLFCIDADTQLDPEAIGLVARHFSDPKVGAVAGNVRVGNPVNVITYWQSLEYTTSQNLDRRAYALLNAITVVPGAIGGWRKSAINEVGGYLNDTLAEDMDLTWRLRKAGYRLENESHAYAYTEAPETFRAFFGQRFRWAYGTLQCLFKHRNALFRYGWFGGLALPSLWVFQVVFQSLAPLVDLEVVISVLRYVTALGSGGSENGAQALGGETQTILQVLFLYGLFFATELVSGIIATRLDRQRYGLLWWLFLQRFAYRQIMYGVIYRSLVRAITGGRTGWGKLDRKGTVKIPIGKS